VPASTPLAIHLARQRRLADVPKWPSALPAIRPGVELLVRPDDHAPDAGDGRQRVGDRGGRRRSRGGMIASRIWAASRARRDFDDRDGQHEVLEINPASAG
jgi:hypothetical protein